MKTLYLLCGLAFSGKSTLAKAIVNYLNCAYVSLDDINKERGLGFGGDGISVEEWENTHQIAIGLLDNLMQLEQDIILDDTNCFRWLRDRFREVAKRHNYKTKVIYLDVPLEEIYIRMQMNEQTKKRQGIKKEIFAQLIQNFQLPEVDENILLFNNEYTIQDWLETQLHSTFNHL
ncbi:MULTISPECIES: ATP-binding protein [unclassified Nostoc]|uniref:ATP-binding protein n=1 Tax=unclassified Nostoc TaxID=2593658 RepID=UPI002634CDC8|nr:ATP-binding protein [Nostoc sp. S13]MDF5734618.1 ATP-binding protein [Nostoc sp. S13]